MAGTNFDRQAFVSAASQGAKQQIPPVALAVPIIVLVVAAFGFLGYKLFSEYSQGGPTVDSQSVARVQEQLSDMSRRLDQLEKHHKAAEPSTPPIKAAANPPVDPGPKRSSYKISSASVLQPQTASNSHLASMIPPPARQPTEDMAVANHEAWQATTDRLADVVGVVGSQQDELSRTREEVNKLLSQTRRSALHFELRRGGNREPVGPVSLLLKNSDPKTQLYTVCVYLENQCIELKNRAVDEVVVFVVSSNSPPLELVATKVLRDQLVGYLEVPSDKPTP